MYSFTKNLVILPALLLAICTNAQKGEIVNTTNKEVVVIIEKKVANAYNVLGRWKQVAQSKQLLGAAKEFEGYYGEPDFDSLTYDSGDAVSVMRITLIWKMNWFPQGYQRKLQVIQYLSEGRKTIIQRGDSLTIGTYSN